MSVLTDTKLYITPYSMAACNRMKKYGRYMTRGKYILVFAKEQPERSAEIKAEHLDGLTQAERVWAATQVQELLAEELEAKKKTILDNASQFMSNFESELVKEKNDGTSASD